MQPFGGDGLSGTGPKAGGPLYLRRLVRDAVAAACRRRRSRCPARPAKRTRSNFIRAASSLCIARDERTLVAQAKAALALGNRC